MCKQLIITKPWFNLNNKNVNIIKNIVCAGGNSDGFGMATEDNGSIAHLKHVKPIGPIPTAYKEIHSLPFVYGAESDLPIKSNMVLLAHGRYSTNVIGREETHPMVSEDKKIALIHNGVVSSDKKYNNLVSETDSELILRAYESGGLSEIESTLSGYYSFGLIDLNEDLLIVVCDDKARLYVSAVESTGSFVFATKDTDISTLGKSSIGKGHRFTSPVQVKPNQIIYFELSTGRFIESTDLVRKKVNVTTGSELDWINSSKTAYEYDEDEEYSADSSKLKRVLNY